MMITDIIGGWSTAIDLYVTLVADPEIKESLDNRHFFQVRPD